MVTHPASTLWVPAGRNRPRVDLRSPPTVNLTESYKDVFPADVLDRYEFAEVRDAASIIAATSEEEFEEIVQVLDGFALEDDDFLVAGGSKGAVAIRLDEAFRELGWREGRHDTKIVSVLRLMPYRAAGETQAKTIESEVLAEAYKVDNVKGSIALDVEWNAKDGNLDRDLGAYRALYDAGIITAGVIVTRTQDDLRALGEKIGRDPFSTTTTTNLPKLLHRLARGDSGGCPVLAVAASAATYEA